MTIAPDDNQSKAVDAQTEPVRIADNVRQAVEGGAVTVTAVAFPFIFLPLAMPTHSFLLPVVVATTIVFGVAGADKVRKNLFWISQKKKAANTKKNSEAIVINTPKPDTLVKEVSKENAPILPVGMFSKD